MQRIGIQTLERRQSVEMISLEMRFAIQYERILFCELEKAMKSGKMEAIGKTKGKEIVYKFVYNYKGKIIEGTCIAKKGVVKLSDAWVKTIGL